MSLESKKSDLRNQEAIEAGHNNNANSYVMQGDDESAEKEYALAREAAERAKALKAEIAALGG
jgi:hypothetical protein